MKKSEFKNKVKRRLGWPMVKVELCDDQISDHLEYATRKFIKWAIGNGTDIIYFTLPLKGGQRYYDLPKGVISIIDYDDNGITGGGINTLFTVENYLFNQGYYDAMFSYPYSILGYHMVLGFMETLNKYNPDKYSWRYHNKTNQLELMPTPEYGKHNLTVDRVDPKTNTLKTYTLDSPGYILLRANVIEGTTLPNVIREWDHVMKEVYSASENRLVTVEEAESDYFVLKNNAIDNELTVYLNGDEYTKWQWFDDDRKIIRWIKPDEIELASDLLLKYKAIDISKSSDDNSYTDNITYITDTYTINPLDIASKTFMLSEKSSNPKDISIELNGETYVYGSGFVVDNDNQTIEFNTYGLDSEVTPGDVLTIKFPNEDSNIEEYDESMYDQLWILDYVTAMCKISLGMIRRKFSNFTSIGNTGISLDGDSLISEGQTEKEKLEEELRDDEVYEGGYICMG